MTDKFDAAIQEIAIKHGVVLSKDDPILILQTMNDRLVEESKQAQAAMLAQFREEMEAIFSQWKDDAKEKAENVLNAALVSSREAMTKILRESNRESCQAIKQMAAETLVEAHDLAQQSKKFRLFALLSSITIIAGLSLYILFTDYF